MPAPCTGECEGSHSHNAAHLDEDEPGRAVLEHMMRLSRMGAKGLPMTLKLCGCKTCRAEVKGATTHADLSTACPPSQR